MDHQQAIRGGPACGSAEDPYLIRPVGNSGSNGLSWRCRLCQYQWSDADRFRHQFVLDRLRFEPFRITEPPGSKTQSRLVP